MYVRVFCHYEVHHPLHGVRSTAVELVGEGLRGTDVGYGADKTGGFVEPGLRGKVGIIVVARSAGGVAADVEARIALILVIEHTRSGADRPLRIRTPRQADTRGEIVVVAMHQSVAEASILHQRNIRPTNLQPGVGIAGTLALAEEDRIPALVGDVGRAVKAVEEHGG